MCVCVCLSSPLTRSRSLFESLISWSPANRVRGFVIVQKNFSRPVKEVKSKRGAVREKGGLVSGSGCVTESEVEADDGDDMMSGMLAIFTD